VKLVIDASVTLKWLLKDDPHEQDVDKALDILDGIVAGSHGMVQPSHWLAEILAVMARRKPKAVEATFETMDELVEEYCVSRAVYLRAADISSRLNQHLFDTLYHALALELGATLITADERYYGAAAQEGAVQRLSDFKAV